MISIKGASRINGELKRSQDQQMAFEREGPFSNQQARAGWRLS